MAKVLTSALRHYCVYHCNTGNYWLLNSSGSAVEVFCDMERACGCDELGGGGGWIRVADIDMSRPEATEETCPEGLSWTILYDYPDKKLLCDGSRDDSCLSTTFSTNGVPYSRVCGKVIGYQSRAPDAFEQYINNGITIDGKFVDGVVLTHGSPRKHIWTFAGGSSQNGTDRTSCPCNVESFDYPLPPFIGNDYFCDSGRKYSTDEEHNNFLDDPLWDGAGCLSGSCCSFNSPPFFCKTLPAQTTDNIELRYCGTPPPRFVGDTPLEVIELYIQ